MVDNKQSKSTFSRFSNYPKALATFSASTPSTSDAETITTPLEGARNLDGFDSTSADRRRKPASEQKRPARNNSGGSRERTLTYSSGAGAGVEGGFWPGEALPPNASGSGFSLSTDGSSFVPSSGSAFSGISETSDGGWAQGQRRFPPPIIEDRNYLSPGDSSGESVSRFARYGQMPNSGSPWNRRADRSRGMRFNVSAAADKGIVGLAKPREGEPGRVVVAGRTYLRILKVPSGERSAPPRDVTPVPPSNKSPSNIAFRRSQSSGRSAAPLNRYSSNEELNRPSRRDEISETTDLRAGSRLGAGYLFSDVQWGFRATSNKIATSFSNGAVALWDLEKEGSNRVDQLKHEHDRAVNTVVFGGPSGSWLLSAGQDGLVKLWDVREARPSNLRLKASSPIRRVSFSPSSAQPHTLLAVCSSGSLIRYDLRSTGKMGGGATDRILGHVGACLGMDWRDELNNRGDSDRGEGGWVVTGGVDGKVHIWDFSVTPLSSKPVRTLYSSQPVQAVAWHPTRGNEIASSPFPSLGVNSHGADESGYGASASEGGSKTSSWKNEIEIWDTREIHFPKATIQMEDPISAILYNDADTIWSTSKTAGVFYQSDVVVDSESLLDSISRPGPIWNIDGELAFVNQDLHPLICPPDLLPPSADHPAVDAPVFRPEAVLCSLPDFDHDFSPSAFAYVAEHSFVGGRPFAEICEINSEVANNVGRADASQLWSLLKLWFDDDPHIPNDREVNEDEQVYFSTGSPSLLSKEWNFSPLITASSSQDTPRMNPQRSFSNPMSRARSTFNSPIIIPADLGMRNIHVFSDDSSTSEDTESKLPVPPPPTRGRSDSLVPHSSDSEEDISGLRNRLASQSGGNSFSANASNTFANSMKKKGRSRSLTMSFGGVRPFSAHLRDENDEQGQDEEGGEGFKLPAPVLGRYQSCRRHSLSSGTESEEDAAQTMARLRNGKNSLIRQSSSGGGTSKTRRTSVVAERRQSGGANLASKTISGGQNSLSVQGAASSGAEKSSTESVMTPTGRPPPPRHSRNKSTVEKMAVGKGHFEEIKTIVETQVKSTLVEYADRGDTQLVALVCSVLRDRMNFEGLFVARVTKAYLDLLRRAQLHPPAAEILKYCSIDALRSLSQKSTTFHGGCGRCGKGLETPPFAYCSRCALSSGCVGFSCCICHLNVTHMMVSCLECSHVAHLSCVEEFTKSLESRLGAVGPPAPLSITELSYPSTPGFPSSSSWLWGSKQEMAVQVEETLEEEREEIRRLAIEIGVALRLSPPNSISTHSASTQRTMKHSQRLLPLFLLISLSKASATSSSANASVPTALPNPNLTAYVPLVPKPGWEDIPFQIQEQQHLHTEEENGNGHADEDERADHDIVTVRETVYQYHRPTSNPIPTQARRGSTKDDTAAGEGDPRPRARPRPRPRTQQDVPVGAVASAVPSFVSLSLSVFLSLLSALYTHLLRPLLYLVLSALALLLSPLTSLAWTVLYPLRIVVQVTRASSPVWISLIAAVGAGAGLGMGAAWVTGGTGTRESNGWVEKVVRKAGGQGWMRERGSGR